MVEIGKFNELRFIKKTENGLILTEGEKEVLLPYVHAPEGAEIGDNLHVFVYIHSDGRLMATTETPIAQVDEFAFLEVVDENENGAFMDMGIGKDVFIPGNEQKRPMKIGQKYVVFLYNDEKTERITASSYLNDFINQDEHDFEEGDECFCEELALHVSYRRPELVQDTKIVNDDEELPEHIRWKLFLVRQLALAKYREARV